MIRISSLGTSVSITRVASGTALTGWSFALCSDIWRRKAAWNGHVLERIALGVTTDSRVLHKAGVDQGWILIGATVNDDAIGILKDVAVAGDAGRVVNWIDQNTFS